MKVGVNGWKWLEMAGSGWKLLEIAGIVWSCLTCLEMEMVGKGWKGWKRLEMAENGSKWPEITGNIWIRLDTLSQENGDSFVILHLNFLFIISFAKKIRWFYILLTFLRVGKYEYRLSKSITKPKYKIQPHFVLQQHFFFGGYTCLTKNSLFNYL